MAGPTDEELVAALQAGDTDCLGTLVVRWEQPLFRFVYRLLPRQEDARDICQETFLRILNKADRFNTGSRFSTWMYQIALNLCRDQLRHRTRWRRVVSEDHAVADLPVRQNATLENGADPLGQAQRKETSTMVHQALDEIPPEQREVLIFKEFEGLRFREIAEILDCPESTVKSRMYYGLSALRSALARHGIDRA